MKNRVILSGLWLLAAALGSVAQEADKASAATPFIRFRATGEREGVLETAVVRYRNADGVEVDLVAAVHIADAAYYRELNRRFERYDAVLYEMVKPTDADPTRRAGGAISFLQRTMKNVLALDFQLDVVDYSKPNFVHADMDAATFRAEQAQRGESLLKLLFRSAMKQWRAEMSGKQKSLGLHEILGALVAPDSARALKYLFAREMERADALLGELGGKDGTVLLEGRNKVVMRVLAERIGAGKKKLAVFYGGGHMPDLERRLRVELGLEKACEEWLRAWDIRSPATREKEDKPGTDGSREPEKDKPKDKAEDKAEDGSKGEPGATKRHEREV
ncbi:MAG: hypothetical protein JXQ29_13740 [Planctomycetes bacterium]|nr:hypothetical protein [Planctomycetota bacterium]